MLFVVTEGDRAEHVVVILEGLGSVVAKVDVPVDVVDISPEE